jgi:hypothetical protein
MVMHEQKEADSEEARRVPDTLENASAAYPRQNATDFAGDVRRRTGRPPSEFTKEENDAINRLMAKAFNEYWDAITLWQRQFPIGSAAWFASVW